MLAHARAYRRAGPRQLVRLFAIPVVVVAGIEGAGIARATLPVACSPMRPRSSRSCASTARSAGNRTIALSNALVGADALDLARLPDLLAWRALGETPRALPPAPIAVAGGAESVHLRFPDRQRGRGAGRRSSSAIADCRPLGHSVRAARSRVARGAGRHRARAAARTAAAGRPHSAGPPRATRSGRADLREQRDPQAARGDRRADGGDQRASTRRPAGAAAKCGCRCRRRSTRGRRKVFAVRCAPLDRVDDVVAMLDDAARRLPRGRRAPQARRAPDRDPVTGLPAAVQGGGRAAAAALH